MVTFKIYSFVEERELARYLPEFRREPRFGAAPRAWSPVVERERVVLGRAGIIRRTGRRLVGVGWSAGTGGGPTT